jgi:hypothetical protein
MSECKLLVILRRCLTAGDYSVEEEQVRSTQALLTAVVGGEVLLVAGIVLWPAAGAVFLAAGLAAVAFVVVVIIGRMRRLAGDVQRLRTSINDIESASRPKPDTEETTTPAPLGATSGAPEPTIWTREATLGGRYTPRQLSDYIAPTAPVAWMVENPFLHVPREETLANVLACERWRHHHGIPELAQSPSLNLAYAQRVDAMLEMFDTALAMTDVNIDQASFLDLGAAEGYVTNHLLDRGATDVDAVELGEGNIEMMWMVRALKGQKGGRIGRIDFDRTDWSAALGRAYDVTLALGVIYHMENPMLFARNLYAATNRAAIVESDTPVFPTNQRFRGFGVMYLHRDQLTVSPGNLRYLTELRPDRQALAEILLAAGFSRVHAIPPATSASSRYFDSGEKTVLLAVP